MHRYFVAHNLLIGFFTCGALALFCLSSCSSESTTACGACPNGTVCDTSDLQCHSLCNNVADCNSGQKCCEGVCRKGSCPNDDTFDPCAALVCGANATCLVVNGVASCKCDAGLQDSNSDRTCLPDCANAQLNCHGPGACGYRVGAASCICDPQYDGTDCLACANGYQDSDVNGTCLPDCARANPNCHGHGTCGYVGGVAGCLCGPEYDGTDCLACADDYQDSNSDSTCLPDCASVQPDCHGHGVCDYVSGAAACACNDGYEGGGCLTCAATYVEWPAGSGTCVDDPCSPSPCPNAHYRCVQTGETATQCLCASGNMVQSGGTGACITSPCGSTICPGWFCHGVMPTCRQWFVPATPTILRNPVMTSAYTALTIADLTGDQVPEILAGQHDDSNAVDIWRYEGGSFVERPSTPSFGASVHQIAVADFNEDGHPDIVSATRWNGFMYLQASGSSWTSAVDMNDPDSSYYAHSLYGPVDLNGDGHQDVIVNHDYQEWIYYGDGHGAFVGGRILGADALNPTGDLNLPSRGTLWPVDLNDDGTLDLFGGWVQGGWSYYMNDYVDYFLRAFINPRTGPQTTPVAWGIELGQFEGQSLGRIDQTPNTGTGNRIQAVMYVASGIGDFNEDGVIDWVTWEWSGPLSTEGTNPPYEIALYTGERDGSSFTWQRSVIADISNGLNTVNGYLTVIDLNKDGHLDILVGRLHTGNGMSIFFGVGNGTFVRQDVTLMTGGGSPAPYGVGADRDPAGIYDYDGDGLLDIVWCAAQGASNLGIAVVSQTSF
jgi:hypothetical protein